MRITVRPYPQDETTRLRDEVESLTQELALIRDTLRHRTAAHQRVIDDLAQLRATLARCNCANSQEPHA